MFTSLYLSRPWSACFEGEDDAAKAAADKAAADAAASAAAAAAAAGKTFTQDEVNRILADDRRKLEDALKKTEKQYQDLLASQSLTEQERKALKANLEMVQGQLRSKEEQLLLEKKQVEEVYAGKLQESEKKASVLRDAVPRFHHRAGAARRRREGTRRSALRRSSRNCVRRRRCCEETDPKTGRLTGKYKPMVEMLDVNPTTGETETKAYTPEEAVKKMKDMPEHWGNLFRSGVVSGIGSGSATGGLMPGQGGKIDVRKLTPTQYREIREKNPELLGLAPKRR